MPHLWVALSPHGFGHAAMTAPLVAELRRRRPGMRVTIQTSLPRDFLETRYGAFDHVPEIADFGLRMSSAIDVLVEESAQAYAGLHADWDGVVAREAERLAAAAPDLVLANIPYVTCAAAARAGVPVAAFSSLNWADIYARYLGHRPEAPGILAQMREAYGRAKVFLRCAPGMPMTLPNIRDIGPVMGSGRRRRDELAARLGAGLIGLIAFGGIDTRLPLENWPVLPGWAWISAQRVEGRADLVFWGDTGFPFADLIPSVDVVVTKPGYGTFTEAAQAGTPVLFVPRPDWPESPTMDDWLGNHTRSLAVPPDRLFGDGLARQLQRLFSLQCPQVAQPTGIAEGADLLERLLSS